MKALLISLIILCNACNMTFEQRTSGMKRPIILVAKACNNYSGSEYCHVILRDSVGKMTTLNSEMYANAIATQL